MIQHNRESFSKLIADTMTNAYRFISQAVINVREASAPRQNLPPARTQPTTNSTCDLPREHSRDTVHYLVSNAAYYLSTHNTILINPKHAQ